MKFQIDSLKHHLKNLNDANELATSAGTSSDVTKMTISERLELPLQGSYDFTISQLAQNQRVTLTNTHQRPSRSTVAHRLIFHCCGNNKSLRLLRFTMPQPQPPRQQHL